MQRIAHIPIFKVVILCFKNLNFINFIFHFFIQS